MKRFLSQKLNVGELPIIQNNLIYRVLQRNDIEEANSLIAKCFTSKEGLSIGCSYQEYYDYLESVKEDYLASQSSLVLVDNARQNLIVGVLLCQDFYAQTICKPKQSHKQQLLSLLVHEFTLRTKQILDKLNIQNTQGVVWFYSKAALHDDYVGQNQILKLISVQKECKIDGIQVFYLFCLISLFVKIFDSLKRI